MPRAIWSGAVSFGLVNIPVKLFNAVSRKTVRFNQIDQRSDARVKRKWVSAADGSDVNGEDIVKGYELSPGNFVMVTEDELAGLDPAASRTIDIEEFIDLHEIDPIFFDSAYYLAPEQTAPKPYALLASAMERADKVGIARFVMRQKQYVAAIRAKEGRLLLSTIVYADEVNDPAALPEMDQVASVELSDKEVEMAEQLIESLSAGFEPEKYEDTYRQKVLDLIEAKRTGEEITIAAAEAEPTKVVDLMAALEASVQEAKEARTRHPSGKASKKAAKKSRKKSSKKTAAKKPRARKSA